MRRVKITQQFTGLVHTRSHPQLCEILDGIGATSPLSGREQSHDAALRREGLRGASSEPTGGTP